ncbi:MAG TPA: ornithine carbamoyltransferase [Gaiellaceae bacterium]|nr:ornithine carbamoyltransferase [Gaiellaceae bacterium]
MATATAPKDFLRVADLTPARLAALLDLAERMDADPDGWVDSLRGHSVALYFAKPSTRTRVSFAAAAARLGLNPILLRPDELQLGRGEPVADTARALSAYCDAVVVRTYAQAELEELAAAASVPVVNALSDEHHPCQALADLLTVRERFGELEGRRLAFVGDGGSNVAHSLLEAGVLAGMEIAIAAPWQHSPAPEVVDRALTIADETGALVDIVSEPADAVRGAHAVYTDVWVSMGEDAERPERFETLRSYRVDEELLALARPDAVFLHCLPAHRGEEVDPEVIDGPQSLVWRQAANRETTEEALLFALLTGDWSG